MTTTCDCHFLYDPKVIKNLKISTGCTAYSSEKAVRKQEKRKRLLNRLQLLIYLQDLMIHDFIRFYSIKKKKKLKKERLNEVKTEIHICIKYFCY